MEQLLLQNISVLEFTTTRVGSYAGKLLASEGANVYKILNDNIDEFCDADKILTPYSEEMFYRKWDIIIVDDCIDTKIVRELYTIDAVIVKIKYEPLISPNETELQAIAGWIDLTGCPLRQGLKIGGYPASFLCGAHVTFIALAGLFERELGQPLIIEVDCLTILLHALEGSVVKFKETSELPARSGNRHKVLAPMCILPSADQYVFIGAPVDAHWELLTRWANLDEKWQLCPTKMRRARILEIEQLLLNWTTQMHADELVTIGQAFRLPFSKVQSIEQVRECEQLRVRQYWQRKKPSQTTIWPKDIAYSHKSRFNQLTMLDLTAMWSGPYCTRLFADLGVNVIKIEAPHRLDGIRGEQGGSTAFFEELNRNKKGLTIDLQTEVGREYFLHLARSSDVVVDNFSPRVMENFNLQAEKLAEINEQLIFASLSAFGQSGPYRDFVGYGPTIEAMSGLADLTTYDIEPWLPGFSISDVAAGIHGAVAIMSALLFKQESAGFVRLDVSQYETAVQLLGDCLYQDSLCKANEAVHYHTFLQALKLSKRIHFYESEGWVVPNNPAPAQGEHNDIFKLEG